MSDPRTARATLAALALALLAGCRTEMYDQPRYEAYESSEFFPDGAANRPPVPGTVSRTGLIADELLNTGKRDGKLVDEFPFAIDEAALKRGRERYDIYCLPCHGATGDGRGMIVRRGFSPPPSFHEPKPSNPPPASKDSEVYYGDLRKAPAGHFFDVITNGHGAMYSYAARIGVEDRWKIAAYIRALQLSQGASVEDLKKIKDKIEGERRLLQEAGR
jgi:mono/diheme cytochrome c family protein